MDNQTGFTWEEIEYYTHRKSGLDFIPTWLVVDCGSDCHVASMKLRNIGCIMTDMKVETNLRAATTDLMDLKQINNIPFFTRVMESGDHFQFSSINFQLAERGGEQCIVSLGLLEKGRCRSQFDWTSGRRNP